MRLQIFTTSKVKYLGSLKLAILTIFVIFACITCKSTDLSESDLQYFYENSRRRKALPVEASSLALMTFDGDGVCTAFALASTIGANLLATARHCAGFNITEACKDKLMFFQALEPEISESRTKARCIRTIAESADLDFAIIEVDRPVTKVGYRLASFDPPIGTRLKMLGYPTDPYAAADGWQMPLVTENCWITDSTRRPNKAVLNYDAMFHNCTTYAGNSGGPMVIEGTDIVIGMPNLYLHDVDLRTIWQFLNARLCLENLWT